MNSFDKIQPYTWHRTGRNEIVLGREKGVYALFLCAGSILPGIRALDNGLIYVGKAEGQDGFHGRCHFNGRTYNHSPRKSLAVLLMNDLDLVPINQTGADGTFKWGLDKASDLRLSEWMYRNLMVALCSDPHPKWLESIILQQISPPLNLTECQKTPCIHHIEELRRGMEVTLKGTSRPTRRGQGKRSLISLRQRYEKSSFSVDFSRLTMAISIADTFGLNHKSYRAALRRKAPDWHDKNQLWLVSPGSEEQRFMIDLATKMARQRPG